jgi:hypothetical protein
MRPPDRRRVTANFDVIDILHVRAGCAPVVDRNNFERSDCAGVEVEWLGYG